MVPLNAENAAFPGHGVQWLTCFSKQSRSFFQSFSIWVMGGMKPFSKSFKGPFQPFPDGLPGLGCGAAFWEKLLEACAASKMAVLPTCSPHDQTIKLSRLWYSTPSPCTINGTTLVFQCFSKHMGCPASLSSFTFCTPVQKPFQAPFGTAEGFVEEFRVVLPKVGKLQVWQEHCCPIFLFQRSLGVNAFHLDVEWLWQHDMWAKLVHNLSMYVATLPTPVTCRCQFLQVIVAGPSFHGQVCHLPDHGGRQNATRPQVQKQVGQARLGPCWLFQALGLFQSHFFPTRFPFLTAIP